MPTTFEVCKPMCWVCKRVLMTHKGLVTHIVAIPAPEAESMCMRGGLTQPIPGHHQALQVYEGF